MGKSEFYELNVERQKEQFFILPSGEVRKYEGDLNEDIGSFHLEIASAAFPDERLPKEKADCKGWIAVGSYIYGFPHAYKFPTESQIYTMRKLGIIDRFHVFEPELNCMLPYYRLLNK